MLFSENSEKSQRFAQAQPRERWTQRGEGLRGLLEVRPDSVADNTLLVRRELPRHGAYAVMRLLGQRTCGSVGLPCPASKPAESSARSAAAAETTAVTSAAPS